MRNRIFRKKKYSLLEQVLISVADFNALAVSNYEGELFAFLGENGAGKSTTINMLCTILEKTIVFTFSPYAFGMDFTQQKMVLYAIAITLACIIIMIFAYSKTYKRK